MLQLEMFSKVIEYRNILRSGLYNDNKTRGIAKGYRKWSASQNSSETITNHQAAAYAASLSVNSLV